MCPKSADRMANSADPDQTAPLHCSSSSSLIWVYTVCSDLSVRKFRNITVTTDLHVRYMAELGFELTTSELKSDKKTDKHPSALLGLTLSLVKDSRCYKPSHPPLPGWDCPGFLFPCLESEWSCPGFLFPCPGSGWSCPGFLCLCPETLSPCLSLSSDLV